jgi:hypothetical protein
MTLSKIRVTILIAVGLCCLSTRPAHAAPAGITLTPALQNITLNTGGRQTFNISLTNHTASVQTFALYALDFGSLNETGGIVFAGSEGSDLIKKYGLAKWISLPSAPVSAAVGETVSIPVTITDSSSLRPGGHYGAIMAAAQTAGVAKGTGIGIDQTLSSLVLAQKVGGEHHDLRLNKVEQDGNWLHPAMKTKLRFYNPGNVHVVPRGIVQVTTPNGKIVAEGIINDESGLLLPETSRQFYVPMHRLASNGLWPGFYKLKVLYRYDGLDRFAERQQMIFFVNLPGIILTICLVAALIVVIFFGQKHVRKTRKPKQPPKTPVSHGTAKHSKLVLR